MLPLHFEGAASSRLMAVDLLSALKDSDLVGAVCLAVLMAFSVYCVATIVLKYRTMNETERQNERFREAASRDGRLESAFLEAKLYPLSPRANILRAAYVEIHAENWFSDCRGLPMEMRMEFARGNIDRALERALNDEMALLEESMGKLGTTAAICPFLGLLGTVWGVLAAFQAIAESGANDMQALAPGISTALTTTIFGLVAAIPATLAYNYFATRIQRLTTDMENHALDLRSIFQRETLRRQADMEVAA